MTEVEVLQPEDSAIRSTFRYPRRHALRRFDEQVAVLREWWPRIDPDSAWRYLQAELLDAPCPPRAEGLFVFVHASFFRSRETGVLNIIAALREQRRGRFRSYLDGKLDAAHLRLRPSTSAAFDLISIRQAGDLWVAYAQFGASHRGKTFERHLDKPHGEFNLDVLSVGSMLITHPWRFVHDTDLHVNCGGAQLARRAHEPFSCTPFFQYVRGKLRFDAFQTDIAYAHDGAATAFIP